MNCDAFDQTIQRTFQQYQPHEHHVQLLSVQQKPMPSGHGDWIIVTVAVAPVSAPTSHRAETWNYGETITQTTDRLPYGVRFIDSTRLIGTNKAAQQLPKGFLLEDAAAELYWSLVPSAREPTYHFYLGKIHMVVGAYSGNRLRQ